MNFFDNIRSRGLVAQVSNEEKLSSFLYNNKTVVYCGFDPTSDSLTVGNLLALIMLKRFAMAGHKPIVLIGNFTGMIGDPSGRSLDRPQLSEQQVHINSQKIAAQAIKVFGTDHLHKIVFNGDFYINQSILTFMRDVGSLFSVNAMLGKDSVQNRMNSGGLTFSEMSYSLFQAADFDFLRKQNNCVLQIGGSDQWGNICAGIELCGKRGHEVFGLTFPLLTKSDGTKFGKSADGAVWLDANKTSVWDFFQFWVNLPDDNIETIFKMFSLKSDDFVRTIIDCHKKNPADRTIQFTLAHEMTEMVHSLEDAYKCLNVSRALFDEEWHLLTVDEFSLASRVVGSIKANTTDSVVSLLVNSKLASSNSDANRLIKSNGVTINGIVVTEPTLQNSTFFHNRFLILKKGKKNVKIVEKINTP